MQVALIVIMAQIGCFVPAKMASLRCIDKLFTHFGTGDSVETNSSSFMVEMKVGSSISCTAGRANKVELHDGYQVSLCFVAVVPSANIIMTLGYLPKLLGYAV